MNERQRAIVDLAMGLLESACAILPVDGVSVADVVEVRAAVCGGWSVVELEGGSLVVRADDRLDRFGDDEAIRRARVVGLEVDDVGNVAISSNARASMFMR